jgi:hypothetical protein
VVRVTEKRPSNNKDITGLPPSEANDSPNLKGFWWLPKAADMLPYLLSDLRRRGFCLFRARHWACRPEGAEASFHNKETLLGILVMRLQVCSVLGWLSGNRFSRLISMLDSGRFSVTPYRPEPAPRRRKGPDFWYKSNRWLSVIGAFFIPTVARPDYKTHSTERKVLRTTWDLALMKYFFYLMLAGLCISAVGLLIITRGTVGKRTNTSSPSCWWALCLSLAWSPISLHSKEPVSR